MSCRHGGQCDANMPHFTVVPVKDQAQASYDSLEGINWVDYRDTGQDQDTVSSDGELETFTKKLVGEARASVRCADCLESVKVGETAS